MRCQTEQRKTRIARRIARRKGDVFFRSDFIDLGSPGQVGRALRTLIQKGCLMKIGHGIYVRARPSVLDGKPTPAKGMRELASEALARLGAAVTESRAERAYTSGRSVQVPTGRVVAIRGKRVRRKLGYRGVILTLERAGADRSLRPPKAKRRAVPSEPPITWRAALRLLWEADRYPIRGNEDVQPALALEKEARARAATATPSPDDPPEIGRWLATLMDRERPESEREAVMEALYDLFDPDGA